MTERIELPFTRGREGSRGNRDLRKGGRNVSFERPMGHPSVEVEWAVGWKLLKLRGKSS